MQLLTPSEAQKRSRSDEALNAVRRRELSDAVVDKSVELATLEGDFQRLLASQRARWALEEADHAAHKREMDAEIDERQAKLKKLLVPIDELRLEAENKLQEAQIVLVRANEKEKYNYDLSVEFEKRFDELSEHKFLASERALKLDRREKGIETQEKHTSQRAKELSEAAKNFLALSEDRERLLKKRQEDIELREINISAREETVTQREEKADYAEKNLQARYKDLEYAEREIRNKNVIQNSIGT